MSMYFLVRKCFVGLENMVARIKGVIIGCLFKKVGKNFMVYSNCYFSGLNNIEVGDNISLSRGCIILGGGGVSIGDNSLFAPYVQIYSEDHAYLDTDKDIIKQTDSIRKKITIGSGCWIGANAIILKGVTVGNRSVIAAGAVVTKDVEPNCVYGGVPARLIRRKTA